MPHPTTRSSECALTPTSSSTAIKQLVFIRHGHSLGQQAAHHDRKRNLALVDCDLSKKGKTQAFALNKRIKNVGGPEIVVASPLTRALKTCLIVFDDENLKCVVHPAFAELNDGNPIPENQGRSYAKLIRDPGLVMHGIEHERVDLSLVEKLGWPNVRHSHRDALRFLAALSQDRIAVISHCNWIANALGVRDWVANCAPIHATLDCGKLTLAMNEEPYDWFIEIHGSSNVNEEGE